MYRIYQRDACTPRLDGPPENNHTAQKIVYFI